MCFCPRLGHVDAKALHQEPFLQGIANYQFIVYHEDPECAPGLRAKVDRTRRANLLAFPAPRACGDIDRVAVGNVVRDRKIDSFALRQAPVKFIEPSTGQAGEHSPQPMQFSASIKEDAESRVTLKFPGSPSSAVISVPASTSMFSWKSPFRKQNWEEASRPIVGSILHIPQ